MPFAVQPIFESFDVPPTGQFELRNPFGVQAGQTWDTTFEVSLDTLLQDGDLVLAADTGTATTVSGASVVAAAGLQAMAQVTSFSVTDSAASIEAGLSALEADTKLTAVTVTSPTGVNNLNLTGLTVAATVDMGADGGSATELDLIIGARRTPTLDLGSDYDSIALGSGPTTIDFKLGSGGGGVEDVTAFNAANDTLLLSLPQGGSVLQTFISGGDWVTSAADHAHGVFLAGVTTSQSVTYANSGQIATLA